jgi:dihydroorotate dehydrogenase (fumarate)
MYYISADPMMDSETVETMYLELVREIERSVTIPLAVKLGHHFTSFAHFARRIAQGGADALVLFNRFYQPDLDLENLEIVPSVNLSTSYELRLRLRWVGLLYGRVDCDLAVTGGVHTAEDVLKSMMAGANVAMLTSALLKQGIEQLDHILRELDNWMVDHEYESIRQMQGSMSQRAVSHPAAYERANYVQVLRSYEPLYMYPR